MLDLELLAEPFTVCRLPAGSPIPAELLPASSRPGARARSAAGDERTPAIMSITWTPVETSIICRSDLAPAGAVVETGWRCLRVSGPLDLALTGILASIATPLANARVNIFAFSTYDTDYVLVPHVRVTEAVSALTAAGHRVINA